VDPWRYVELAGGVGGAQLRRHMRRLALADGGCLEDAEVSARTRDVWPRALDQSVVNDSCGGGNGGSARAARMARGPAWSEPVDAL
jgi:hypothetical protein